MNIERGDGMRLRNIRGSREVIAANEYVVHEAETKRGQWNSVFGNGKDRKSVV